MSVQSVPRVLRRLESLDKKFLGKELPNTVINALGTGLVAPVFIAYNPVSKTDEDTKKYSALRQPVSAVVTVLTQFAAIAPLNKFIDKHIAKGTFGKFFNASAPAAYKAFLKAGTGLAAGLAVVPLSCGILNWAYPKFVEKFFPQLCKDDCPKGGQSGNK